MAVLLLGKHYGHEFDVLRDEIRRRGGTAEIIDTNDWPGEDPVTLHPDEGTLRFGDCVLSLDEIDGVYFRQNSLFVPAVEDYVDGCISEDDNPYSVITQLREYRGLFRTVLKALERRNLPVAPGVGALDWQETGPHACALFESLDIPTPETLVTTDPDEVKRFVRENGKVVYKPIAELGGADVMTSDEAEQLDGLVSPVMFQELVPGEDVRAYVIDGEYVGAFEYTAEAEAFSFKDDPDDVAAEPIELPESVKRDVLRAVEASGLTYSAVDVRLDTDGSHTLLEANGGGRFMLSDSSGATNVTDAMVEYLLGNRAV